MRFTQFGLILVCSLVAGTQSAQAKAHEQAPPMTDEQNAAYIQSAMTAAQDPQNQSLAAKLFCYCGCDQEHGHQNLLDCYKDGHVPECKTCQSEFIRTSQLSSQGAQLGQIQNEIDKEFKGAYPFKHPGPILKRYISSKVSNTMM